MFDLVRNPEDQFSRVVAVMILHVISINMYFQVLLINQDVISGELKHRRVETFGRDKA